jgi:hypothetical protein
VAIIVYTSQHNVKGAVNDAPNEAVQKAHCSNPNVIGVRDFHPNNDPQEIIATFTICFIQKTTAEVNDQDDRW